MASLASQSITLLESDNEWPTQNNPVEILATQPLHAFATGRILVRDEDGSDRINAPIRASADRTVTYLLENEPWIKKSSKITVRVSWFNRSDPPGYKEITLKRS